MLRRQTLPTSVAALCLALGIAGTTAMFSVGHTMLLRPLPYPNGERLVSIHTRTRALVATGFIDFPVMAAHFERTQIFSPATIPLLCATPRL